MIGKQELAQVLLSIVIGLAAAVLLVEVAANHLPLFQTDVRFVSEIMKEDPDIHRKFLADADVTYFSADMQRYNVKTHRIVDDYYGRDETPQGGVWAVAIGDSFTFCSEIPIEDCWVDVLEKKEGRVVANLGGPGQFTIMEERILERYGLKLEPEVVIWEFMTNDLSETAYYKYNNTAPPLKGVRAFLNAHSNVYVLTKRILNAFASPSERPVTFEIDGELNVFNTPSAAMGTSAWCGTEVEEEVLYTIQRAAQKTEESGATFVLLLVPMKEEIYIDQYNRNQNSSSDFSCPIRAVKAMAESEGIRYVDMTSVFLEASKTQNPYLSRGGHLSSYGNALVVEALGPALDST